MPNGATSGQISVTNSRATATSTGSYTVTVPTITSFTPTSGPVGTFVTVTGTLLTGATDLLLNGTSVPGYTVVDANTVTFTVLLGATSGPISIVTSLGTPVSPTNYTVTIAPPPTLTSVVRNIGPAGTIVTLTGTNFLGFVTVDFNGTPATVFTVNSPTSITVTVPAGTTTGNVTVTTPGGTTNGVLFTIAPAPFITALSPARNANTAATTTTVAVTFDQPVTNGSDIKIFSQQYRGLRSATTNTSGNTVTLTPTTPSGGLQNADFEPGETVYVTVPATLEAANTVPARAEVYQFTMAAGVGPAVFQKNGTLTTGNNLNKIRLADLDNDGDLDMLFSDNGDNKVYVRTNNGAGAFSGTTIVTMASLVYDIVTADIDNDGDLDLLTVGSPGAGSGFISIRTNDGMGSFSGTTNLTAPNSAFQLAAADIDADGDLDLICQLSLSPSTAGIYLNNGTGSFTLGTNSLPNGGVYITMADVDGDGDLDAVRSGQSNLANINLNNGRGAFGPNVNVLLGGTPEGGLAMGDLDGDGDLDMASTDSNNNTVSVRMNNGSGVFTAPTNSTFGTGARPQSIQLADFDGDGDLDFVTANRNGNNAGVRLNNGSGVFSGADVTVDAAPFSVATGDIDGDGDLDFVTAHFVNTGNRVNVYFNRAVPTITSFTPTSGPVGTVVTVTGTNLNGTTSLTLNGVSVTVYTVVSSTSITFTVPSGATTGQIAVVTPGGSANTSGLSTPNYTVTAPSPPTITAIAPPSGPVGTVVTVTGTNFTGTTDLKLNGTSITGYTVVSSTEITFTVPPGATTGTVSVTTPGGTATGPTYTVTTPQPPTITSFGPTSGPVGTVVTVTGTNFTGTTSLKLNGGNITGYTVVDPNTITFTVPPGATSGQISVTTPNGTATSTGSYTVTVPPTITSFTPPSGPVGTVVTVTGTGFTGTTDLKLNGTSVTGYTVVSNTQITFTVPSGATTGTVSVTTPNGTATGPTYTVTTPSGPPTITSFGPTSGPVGTVVTVTGTNFTGTTGLTLNGQTVTGYTVVSGTSITFTVPPGATSGQISVTTPQGTATSTGSYTVTTGVPDLTVNTGTTGTPTTIPGGTYGRVTITGTGVGRFGGPVTVLTSLVVQPGGSLDTNCLPLTGAGSFALQPGATLYICDADGITSTAPTGTIRVTGARAYASDASYIYNGTAPQVSGVALPAQVRNLTVDNGNNGLTLTNPVAITQVLALTNGDLDVNGKTLTLRSQRGVGTALLDNTGGVVTGNGTGTMERAIDIYTPDNIGYHHFSTPVRTGATAGPVIDVALANQNFQLNPAYNTAAVAGTVRPFPTIYGYDETRIAPSIAAGIAVDKSQFDKGFFCPTTGDAMVIGKGYTGNIPNATALAFTTNLTTGGAFNNGPVTLSGLSRGTDTEAGWQFIGNPYPSPLDAATLTTAQRTNLGAAVYVYHATSRYSGFYTTFLPDGSGGGTGTTDGSGSSSLINAGTAFFMRVVAPGSSNGALALTNANRATTFGTQPAFGRQTASRPALTLQVTGAGTTDALTLYADARATAGLDADYDATKLANPTGLNLAALAGTTQLAIDGLPTMTATTVVPLTLGAPAPGTYTLAVPALANFGSTRVYLRDAVAGTETLLTGGTQVPVTLTTVATATTRFSLVFRPGGALATAPNALAAEARVYPNPARGRFTLLLPPVAGATKATATLCNALGQVVNTRTLALTAGGATADYATSGLAAGVYALRLQAGAQTATIRVVVE